MSKSLLKVFYNQNQIHNMSKGLYTGSGWVIVKDGKEYINKKYVGIKNTNLEGHYHALINSLRDINHMKDVYCKIEIYGSSKIVTDHMNNVCLPIDVKIKKLLVDAKSMSDLHEDISFIYVKDEKPVKGLDKQAFEHLQTAKLLASMSINAKLSGFSW
jgi:ribonuclease HI